MIMIILFSVFLLILAAKGKLARPLAGAFTAGLILMWGLYHPAEASSAQTHAVAFLESAWNVAGNVFDAARKAV